MVEAVADLAMNGRYHEVPGLGHGSAARHAQDTVNSLLLEIIAAEVQLDPET